MLKYRRPAIGPDGTLYIGTIGTTFYALNPSGAVKWTFTTDSSGIESSPVVDASGVIYLGDLNAIYAVPSNGSPQRWKATTLLCPMVGAPVVVQGTLVVGCANGRFLAIEA